jgi:thiol:disulfide interchange protein
MKLLAILSAIFLPLLLIIIYFLSVSNTEAGLRNLITAKQVANTTEQDNMWKTIKQVAQVTDAQKNAIMEVVVGYATARGGGKSGSLATLVHESVP